MLLWTFVMQWACGSGFAACLAESLFAYRPKATGGMSCGDDMKSNVVAARSSPPGHCRHPATSAERRRSALYGAATLGGAPSS